MNILVLGSGAREHALAWKLKQSPQSPTVRVSPGNGGTDSVPVAGDPVGWCHENRVDLVVIGPEAPLAEGLADRLREAGIAVFGPSRAAARLESDKAFCKSFALQHGIPTAAYQAFSELEPALAHLRSLERLPVLKATGLAAGKGVLVPDSLSEAERWLQGALSGELFGAAGQTVVLEERLEGREVSLMAFCDGERYSLMPPVMDHKRVGEHDRGPNTGGMGTVSPPPDFDMDQLPWLGELFIGAALQGMREQGTPFQGVLFAGLMLTADGPKLLEYNCRFGDPETESVLLLLESDLLPILLQCSQGQLTEKPRWHPESAATVVLCSGGYPGKLTGLGEPIRGVAGLNGEVQVFHAGTRLEDGVLVTSGGRVLAVSGRAPSLDQALRKVYAAIAQIDFAGSHYRRDIGRLS